MTASQSTTRMYPFYGFSITAFLLLVISRRSIAATGNFDVCVVGAGPSGVTSAYLAETRGHSSVALLEREDYVGGKTKTTTLNNGERHRMGAIVHFVVGGFLDRLFAEFDIELEPTVYEGSRARFYNGAEFDDTFAGFQLSFSVAFQLAKYMILRTFLLGLGSVDLFETPDYPNELDTSSFQQWLENNGMPLLVDLFWYSWEGIGYGQQQDVPAIYGLRLLDAWTVFGSLTFGSFYSPQRNVFYEDLFQAMVEGLRGSVYLSATITSVTYGATEEDANVIFFHQDDQPEQSITCESIIIAFPPLSGAMEVFTPPTIAPALNTLTAQVRTIDYYSLIVSSDQSSRFEPNDGPLQFFYHVPLAEVPDDPGIPIFYYKQLPSPNSSLVAYHWVPTNNKTPEVAQAEILAAYSALSGYAVDQISVQDLNRWPYFPHVSSASLESGFYTDFEALQGTSNQYYTGGLFSFESVRDSIEHAEYIFETYFAK